MNDMIESVGGVIRNQCFRENGHSFAHNDTNLTDICIVTGKSKNRLYKLDICNRIL